MSAYLLVWDWNGRSFSPACDWAFGALSLSGGVGFLCFLPIARPVRVLFALAYIPVMGYLLFFYAFSFVMVVFGDWL
jgi:hypothetical protein